MKMQAYMSVFDWIASQNKMIEELLHPNWQRHMESIPELLQTRKEDVLTWLKEGFQRGGSGVPTRQDLEIIVEHVREQFLLVQDQYHAEGNRNLTIVEGIIESQANSVSFPEPNKTAAEKPNDIESRIRNFCTSFPMHSNTDVSMY